MHTQKKCGTSGTSGEAKNRSHCHTQVRSPPRQPLAAAGLARSTYFYHLKQLDNPDKYTELKDAIKTIFEKMKQRYGYRSIHTELRKQGWQVNHKLVYKLMDQMRLKSKVRPRRKYNSYKGQTSHIADNLLDRNFTPDKPNTVWVSDITAF